MKQWKIINHMTVRINGTEYEISNSRGFPTFFGNCAEDATPRQIYEQHYPSPKEDGVLAERKTLFFITDSYFGFASVYALGATLTPHEVTQSQEGYILRYASSARQKADKTVEWHDRPIIVMTDGLVKLPDTVLYTVENKGAVVVKKSRFLSHDIEQLNAVVEWLEANGHAWAYM